MTTTNRQLVLPLDIDHTCEQRYRPSFGFHWEAAPPLVSANECPACTYLRGAQDGQPTCVPKGIGPARKAAAHAHFEEVAKDWLREARACARRQCELTGSVTSDDVREAIGEPPEGIHRNVWGAIWSTGEFKVIGWMHSKRPSSNGRAIRRWALR